MEPLSSVHYFTSYNMHLVENVFGDFCAVNTSTYRKFLVHNPKQSKILAVSVATIPAIDEKDVPEDANIADDAVPPSIIVFVSFADEDIVSVFCLSATSSSTAAVGACGAGIISFETDTLVAIIGGVGLIITLDGA